MPAPGTLYVVATPIGNLEDLTLRAIRVLREVRLIAAEDTRRTAKLLSHLGIQSKLLSFHAHNAHERLPRLIAHLGAGTSVALVTDAGTPGVSDPGVELVAACRQAHIPVDPVPGATAPIAAALASGFSMIPLTIHGFPPHGVNDRNKWWSVIAATANTETFFESPHRIQQTLREAADKLGDRPIMVGRELTKLHQEFVFGTAMELVDRFNDAKGEFTVVVSANDKSSVNNRMDVSDDVIIAEFGVLTESMARSRREAITSVATKFGWSPKEVYATIERAKKATV